MKYARLVMMIGLAVGGLTTTIIINAHDYKMRVDIPRSEVQGYQIDQLAGNIDRSLSTIQTDTLFRRILYNDQQLVRYWMLAGK